MASQTDQAPPRPLAVGHGQAPRPKRPRRRSPLPAILGATWLVLAAYPVYYMFISSLRRQGDYVAGSPWLPPLRPTAENYIAVVEDGIGLYFVNSLFVVVLTVLLIVVVSVLAAYAIARTPNRLMRSAFKMFLLGLAIPIQAAIIPVYLLIARIGLYDTLYGLIPPQAAFGIPLTILILVNFIRDIPNELYDSMVIDGGGHARLLWNLVLPLSRPALVTVVIYNSLQVWNNFLFPLILTQSANVQTLPLALQRFQGQYGINVPGLMAAVFLSVLPILALYIVARRQLIAGLAAGFGK